MNTYSSIQMLLNLGITAYIVGMLASMSTRGDEDTREFREKVR